MKKHWIKRVHHLPKGVCLLGVIGLALLFIGCGKSGEKPNAPKKTKEVSDKAEA